MTTANNDVVFEQGDVFVHTTIPTSTLNDNIIRGKINIIVKEGELYVEWSPICLTPDVEYEIHSILSGPIEYGVVYAQNVDENERQAPEANLKKENYKISFTVESIYSIRSSAAKLSWPYVVFQLKDGSRQPALHFHNRGIKEMISTLQRYIWLTVSPTNKKLFIVQEKSGAIGSSLNQFDIFGDKPTDTLQKIFDGTYYGALGLFSKVSQNVRDSMGRSELQERRPTPACSEQSVVERDGSMDGEFEVVHKDELPDRLERIISVSRGSPLQPEEWCSFINEDGSITKVHELKEKIFRGGVHHDIRREAWKFLLGYYSFESTWEQRKLSVEEKKKSYHRIKNQWSSISADQEKRFTEFAAKKHLIHKDAVRTDRALPFYEGDNNPNTKKLFDILMTYCMYNFDLGYVQGMSDLLSPILMLMESEEDAFWCFVGLMEIEEQIFEETQELTKQNLHKLSKLIQFLYPRFAAFLDRCESGNLYFCFRWIIVSFKRDFTNQDLLTLWEAFWTQTMSPNFKLFVCLAILEGEIDHMMSNNFDFNDILKHINTLGPHLDLQHTLSRAESLCIQLRAMDDLPTEIKSILYFPHELELQENIEKEIQNPESITSTNAGPTTLSNTSSDDAVVELNENTHPVF